MKKHYNAVVTGLSIGIFNIFLAYIKIPSRGLCNGACGSCGSSCEIAILGLIGVLVIAKKWIKGIFVNSQSTIKQKHL